MKNIINIIGASLLSYFLYFLPVFAEVTCRINDEIVQCPDWLTNNFELIFIFCILLTVFLIVSFWKIFKKAGQKGWIILIPIYNAITILRISGFSGWYILLMFIPFVNIIFYIILMNSLSKSFNKGPGFTIGLIILPIIFFPILAFGDATHNSNN